MSAIIFSPKEEKEIIQSYLNGDTAKTIEKRVGCSNRPILRILHRARVIRHNEVFRGKRVYNYNGCFQSIDTAEKAYWLGFITGDGCNRHLNSRRDSWKFKLELAKRDYNTLKRFCIFIGYPINKIGEDRGQFVYVEVVNKAFCKDLVKHGIIPKKSNRLAFPAFLSDSLLKSWIAGIIDADGSVCLTPYQPTKRRVEIALYSMQQKLLTSIQNFLVKSFIVRKNKIPFSKGAYKLAWSGRDAKRLVDVLFKDVEDICIYRKSGVVKTYCKIQQND